MTTDLLFLAAVILTASAIYGTVAIIFKKTILKPLVASLLLQSAQVAISGYVIGKYGLWHLV